MAGFLWPHALAGANPFLGDQINNNHIYKTDMYVLMMTCLNKDTLNTVVLTTQSKMFTNIWLDFNIIK